MKLDHALDAYHRTGMFAVGILDGRELRRRTLEPPAQLARAYIHALAGFLQAVPFVIRRVKTSHQSAGLASAVVMVE